MKYKQCQSDTHSSDFLSWDDFKDIARRALETLPPEGRPSLDDVLKHIEAELKNPPRYGPANGVASYFQKLLSELQRILVIALGVHCEALLACLNM